MNFLLVNFLEKTLMNNSDGRTGVDDGFDRLIGYFDFNVNWPGRQ